jgi:hypothetical protein
MHGRLQSKQYTESFLSSNIKLIFVSSCKVMVLVANRLGIARKNNVFGGNFGIFGLGETAFFRL